MKGMPWGGPGREGSAGWGIPWTKLIDCSQEKGRTLTPDDRLSKIFTDATTKGAPKATSVTEERLGKEIPFRRKQEN